MKAYETENIINCRDMGGYRCAGGTTAYGVAVRCGIPRDPTVKDIELLKELGIKHIIDLRGIREAEEMPSVFASRQDFDYFQCTTLEANPALNDVGLPIWQMYRMSLEGFRENYAKIFRYIISLKEPFMFHCFLGKDRTGLLSALLLGAAGADRETIIEDYTASRNFVKPFADREIAAGTGLIWDQDESRLQSKREYMTDTLKMLDSLYGGIPGYLGYIGLTEDEIACLGKVLIK